MLESGEKTLAQKHACRADGSLASLTLPMVPLAHVCVQDVFVHIGYVHTAIYICIHIFSMDARVCVCVCVWSLGVQ